MRTLLLSVIAILTLSQNISAAELPPEAYEKNTTDADANALIERAKQLIELINKDPTWANNNKNLTNISNNSRIWTYSAMLGSIGPVAIEEISKATSKARGLKKIVLASALIHAGAPAEGSEIILKAIASTKSSETKILALRSLSIAQSLHSVDKILESISIMFAGEPDIATRIAYADAILKLTTKWGRVTGSSQGAIFRTEAMQFLEESTKSTDDKIVREAALVLGENGFEFMTSGLLKSIALEPTPSGRRARLITSGVRPQWAALLQEVASTLQDGYVDEDKVNPDALFEAAARGMIRSLDDYSDYLSKNDVASMEERLRNAYEGIGTYISVRDNYLVIESPIYNGPAYRAGLRSNDTIIEIDGHATEERTLEENITLLKGPRDTKVKLKVVRSGWSSPHEFIITREEIHVRTVYETLMPGKIGYIRLTRFGENAGLDVKRAVSSLKKRGASALVLDLRDNGGGLLGEAVNVSDVFLSAGKAVVYSQGRSDYAPLKRFYSATEDQTDRMPLAVLINVGTASASEIVTGALQDWGRAVVVGENSYGKGSVQSLIPVRATNHATKIRMTIARYYLPSGRPITKERPVEPNIDIPAAEYKPWESEEIISLKLTEKVDALLREMMGKRKTVVRNIAQNHTLELSDIPGLETLAASSNTNLRADSLISLARVSARSLMADIRGSEYVVDLREDTVLRRGVYELLMSFEAQEKLPGVCRDILAEFAGSEKK